MPVMTAPKSSIGRSIGSVMWRNRPHPVAPSTSAASFISLGIVWRPARKMIIRVPKLRQTDISTSDGSASVVLSSQPGPVDADPAEDGVEEAAVVAVEELPDHRDRDDAGHDREVVADPEEALEAVEPVDADGHGQGDAPW